jgi:exosome complex exonuclease RRP6
MAKAPTGNSPEVDPLKDLLASLAAGARAVNGIPVDDDFSFQASFPEFAAALNSAQDSLRGIVLEVLDDQMDLEDETMDDPFLLEQAADLCDLLMEQIENYLQSSSAAGQAATNDLSLQEFSQSARDRSKKSMSRMMKGIVEMEKPQKAYKIQIPDNRREVPFVPRVHAKKPHGSTPLDLTLQDGSGWETRFSGTKPASVIPSGAVLPRKHVLHPYQQEIEGFQYTSWQLECPLSSLPSLPLPKGPSPLPFTWIDSSKALDSMARKLRNVKEIAIDLEAHSYRSFAGLVCLMQISIRDKSGVIESFLIDTLALHSDLNAALADPLANPAIVKIFHGADSDMAWLQRDFGLYVVNLFDTGRASRALKFSKASYAYLLSRYFGIQADKSYQLADWRQRPLTATMQEYAVQDTYYLLTIYDYLRYELSEHKEASIEQVLEVSRQVSLIRYAGEAFRPSGYQVLLGRGRRSKTEHRLTDRQEAILAALWDWRDSVGRRLDESPTFILPKDSLWKLAMSSPTNLTALQSLFQPLPEQLMALSSEILNVIKQASTGDSQKTIPASPRRDKDDQDEADGDEDDDDWEEEDLQRVPSSSSAFFKPTPANDRQRRGMMSPVLGTEALYQQAGWMTPQEVVLVESSTTENEEKDDTPGKPRRLLSVHTSNSHFHAKEVSSHSLELSSPEAGRGRTVSGMATVRAAREASTSPLLTSTEEDVVKMARQTSAQIRSTSLSKEVIPGVLGVLAHAPVSNEVDDEDDDEGPEDGATDEKVEIEEEDFVIPRSIRDIYKISNRNRRNKKAYSPTPERGATPTSEKEREELVRAEAVLAERGAEAVGYLFEDNSPKRPRTKSTGGSEGSPAPEAGTASKQEDLTFMREVGFVPPHLSNEAILAQQYGDTSAVPEANKNPYYEYAPVAMSAAAGNSGVNPFFSGAALQGGALAASHKPRKAKPAGSGSGSGSGNYNNGGGSSSKKANRRGERPEKKDGQSFAYRSKR